MEHTEQRYPNEALRYQDILIERTLTQDVSQEVSLPDYQPEIKRLLHVSATVQPPTRYVGGGSIEFSGNVDVNILYAGEDNALYCFPTSLEYTLHTVAEGDSGLSYLPDESMCCYAVADVDTLNCRVGGPRRLSLRCRIRGQISALGSRCPEEIWSGEVIGEVQRLHREVCVARVLCGNSAPLLLSDDILLEHPEESDTLRIVTAEAAVLPDEITTAADRVSCRGQVVVKLLLQKEAGEDDTAPLPTTLHRKLPFSVDIPVEGLLPGGEAIVTGSCTELHLTLDDGKLRCDAEVLLQARTQHRERICYTEDLCCIGQHSAIETAAEHLCRPLRCFNGNFSQNEILSAKESTLPVGAHLLDTCGCVLPERTQLSVEGGRCILTGACRYALIYEADGELGARELELPFRFSIDAGPLPESGIEHIGCDRVVQLVSIRGRLDERDGKLNIDAELSVSLRLWESLEIFPVCSIRAEEICTTPVGARILYYPLPGETLWSVAKRYCRAVETISIKNRLSCAVRADDPGSLSGVRVLVI